MNDGIDKGVRILLEALVPLDCGRFKGLGFKILCLWISGLWISGFFYRFAGFHSLQGFILSKAGCYEVVHASIGLVSSIYRVSYAFLYRV